MKCIIQHFSTLKCDKMNQLVLRYKYHKKMKLINVAIEVRVFKHNIVKMQRVNIIVDMVYILFHIHSLVQFWLVTILVLLLGLNYILKIIGQQWLFGNKNFVCHWLYWAPSSVYQLQVHYLIHMDQNPLFSFLVYSISWALFSLSLLKSFQSWC